MTGKRLSAIHLKQLTKPGRYTDEGGLHFHVRSAERRAWVFRYMIGGRSRDIGLGAYPRVSLAEARKKAEEARHQINSGMDPLAVRAAEIASRETDAGRTFRIAAMELLQDKGQSWRNAKHRWQWLATLEKYAFPAFGNSPIQAVSNDAVMSVLRPIWNKIPETASRLRGRIEAVLDAAKARGWYYGENPARWKGNLQLRLPSPKKVKAVQHQPALAWTAVPAFMTALRAREGLAARCLEFVILTAARSGEARGMRWGEVDLEQAIWTVPSSRMKAARMHRVPIPQAALNVLRQIKPDDEGPDKLVFPGSRNDRPLSDMSLTALVRRINRVPANGPPPWRDPVQNAPIVVHGFRSTFRVWAGEATNYPREVIEAALAHTLKDRVEAAYARTDLVERRRPLMTEWAKHCGAGMPGVASVHQFG